MISTKTSRPLSFAFFVGVLSACSGTNPQQRGFTACGGTSCQPGQYCAGGVICEVGCTSDLNCLDNQTCDTSTAPGTCQNNSVVGQPDSSVSSDARTEQTVVTGPGAAICQRLAPLVSSCAGQTWSLSSCETTYNQAVSRGCAETWVSAFAEFVRTNGQFECRAPFPGASVDLLPTTNNELVLLGMVCPTTVQDANCYGLSCSFGSDCSGFPASANCNGATEHCRSETSVCPALPCESGSDCPGFPATANCNSALGVCIRQQ